jgi:homoserine O-acetyltransferase/O-succinyltransferase
MVDLQHRLVTETLVIKRLHAILGMSMGGMNAWQWAEAYPDAMDGAMHVVTLPIKVSGRNLIWRRRPSHRASRMATMSCNPVARIRSAI